MPTKPRREDAFVERLLKVYENGSWDGAYLEWLDRKFDGAVEIRATRRSDGRTLALEHTIIEPFAGEKRDFAFFEAEFASIERDLSLIVPGLWIQLFVPVGIFDKQRDRSVRRRVVATIQAWLRDNRLQLRQGQHRYNCPIPELRRVITLTAKVVSLRRGSALESGVLHVCRQQIVDDLGDVVDRALRKKLPKLASTIADKRILLLERQHMNLVPRRVLEEIETRRTSFPELAHISEIWFVETMFYGTSFGGEHLRFELIQGEREVSSYDLDGDRLWMKFENGHAEVVSRMNP